MIVAIVIFFVVVTALAAGITWLMARRRFLIDKPNHRSSHVLPTPRAGGVGIVVAATLGVIALGLNGHPTVLRDPGFLAVLLGALVAAGGGLADDIKARTYAVKLGVQFAAAAIALWLGLVIETLYIPGLGPVLLGPVIGPLLTLVWIIGLTNAYNFMDGIDGLAGGTALIGFGFLMAALLTLGQIDSGSLACTFAAASLGFLVLNLPPARIFMGDVGSQFLGFAFAALGVLAARSDPSGTLIYLVPLLLLHFLFDTMFTAIRRWRNGENITQAHRSHLYQRLTHAGFGHAKATAALCAMGVAQGVGALWLVNQSPSLRLAIFVPAFLLQIVYALAVTRYETGVTE